MFISFEGLDGCGKTTQAAMLADALEAEGARIVRVREPGGTPAGERIRSLLLDPGEMIAGAPRRCSTPPPARSWWTT